MTDLFDDFAILLDIIRLHSKFSIEMLHFMAIISTFLKTLCNRLQKCFKVLFLTVNSACQRNPGTPPS
jgi:hypothetical protein